MNNSKGFKDLIVYQKAFDQAMQIMKLSRSFPAQERYNLTSQIVRSSRAVCSNIAEGYRKRIYPKHFVSKMTDSDSENSETDMWLDFVVACEYDNEDNIVKLRHLNNEIGKMLNFMITNPEKFLPKKDK
ncbi:diversity-generating retroelement protein bAvd family protein [Nonlabens sp. MB-3u-79]|jgi:four helix bundle protein|uniref:four helix bundle protein n=1 Tax=Nonlabens sp. MB-3u-79 TaxID=2058134 RepID=UPI000C312F83|nr:four helix bundle protein [Nonlabens sp. MB-3u-79]AUC80209.1 diversity-generating retroelement protein bAvd family protein [Nonlabens sp. MB-3u-79]|tara:strand:+ start:104 stop:490 length:387 start_codon:yes stop_codon:yes gene_type:complete